ncbi:MAG TPA: DUF3168 domain-containing protein [Allosphingosinicella sp.]|jgi:hypothetical protein
MSAGEKLQQAVSAALQAIGGIGVYEGPPLQAAAPYAVVEAGPETNWSHKSGTGREVRIAVSLFDRGERPVRLRSLMGEAEAALDALAGPTGWQLVAMQFLRSRLVRDTQGVWAGVIEYRARLLSTG